MATKHQVIIEQTRVAASAKVIYHDGVLWLEGYDHRGTEVIRIFFAEPLFVRISDEGVRLRLQQEVGEGRPLVLVDKFSSLLRWIDEEGLHTRDLSRARHFIVVIGEEIVDVVSLSDPELLMRA